MWVLDYYVTIINSVVTVDCIEGLWLILIVNVSQRFIFSTFYFSFTTIFFQNWLLIVSLNLTDEQNPKAVWEPALAGLVGELISGVNVILYVTNLISSVLGQ